MYTQSELDILSALRSIDNKLTQIIHLLERLTDRMDETRPRG